MRFLYLIIGISLCTTYYALYKSNQQQDTEMLTNQLILDQQLELETGETGQLNYDETSQSYKLDEENGNTHVSYMAIKGDFIFEATIYQLTDSTPHGAGIFVKSDVREEYNGVALSTEKNNKVYAHALVYSLVEKTFFPYTTVLGTDLEEAKTGFEPLYLRIERHGNNIISTAHSKYIISYAFDSTNTDERQLLIEDWDSVYIGLMTNKSVKFSNVRISRPLVMKEGNIADGEQVISRLEILDIETKERKVIHQETKHFEAPNWHQTKDYLIFNQQGLLYKIPSNGGKPTLIPTGALKNCNNDHGITPDGKTLIISNNDEAFSSRIYTIPLEGGEPTLITPKGPSYWHGVSPDGKVLAYVGNRGEDYNIYTIPINGGKEVEITTSLGLDDGPDYSIDGKYIYMNSMQTGQMRIWQMNTDGSEQKQLTDDEEYQDWFPHPSPDGRWLIFLSYPKEVAASSHPFGERVVLRLLDLENLDNTPTILTHLYGGQGTINVPSWSADSKKVAFVSYSSVNE